MKTYNNTLELINELPRFMVPNECYDLYWYVKLKNNSEYKVIIPKEVINKLNSKYKNDDNDIKFNKDLKIFKKELMSSQKLKFFRSGKVIYYNDEIPNNMIQCNECGNIWDGFAQCNCFLDINEFF